MYAVLLACLHACLQASLSGLAASLLAQDTRSSGSQNRHMHVMGRPDGGADAGGAGASGDADQGSDGSAGGGVPCSRRDDARMQGTLHAAQALLSRALSMQLHVAQAAAVQHVQDAQHKEPSQPAVQHGAPHLVQQAVLQRSALLALALALHTGQPMQQISALLSAVQRLHAADAIQLEALAMQHMQAAESAACDESLGSVHGSVDSCGGSSGGAQIGCLLLGAALRAAAAAAPGPSPPPMQPGGNGSGGSDGSGGSGDNGGSGGSGSQAAGRGDARPDLVTAARVSTPACVSTCVHITCMRACHIPH